MYLQADESVPHTGTIQDGICLNDEDYTNNNVTVSARWSGFYDDESYIRHYTFCAGSSTGLDDIVACTNVGIKTYIQILVENQLQTGWHTLHNEFDSIKNNKCLQ